MPITTPAELREHLELAIQIELSTIPPYLYAMYSIENQDSDAALLIRSIAAEEMLHAALVTNVLLAVGGRPRFATSAYMPDYPELLPHHTPPLELNLEPVSVESIRGVFMRIEQPELHGAPSEPDIFETLGQFYHAVEEGIAAINETHDIFANPQVERQLADPSFYAPVKFDAADSGGLSLVTDVASADAAIEVIVHQGEGLSTERWADPAHQELTHYYKLLEIAEGRSPLGEVKPVPRNPKTAGYPAELRPVSDLFNACYRHLFWILDELFGPSPDKLGPVEQMYQLMADVMSGLAHFLVRQTLPDGRAGAPTFEIFEFSTPDHRAELEALARRVAEENSELASLCSSIVEMAHR